MTSLLLMVVRTTPVMILIGRQYRSRTSNVSDIVELDDNLFDMLDISNVPEYCNVNMLSNYKLAEIGGLAKTKLV